MRPVAGVYLIGGITLVSEIPLPELPLIQQQSATPHPVHLRLGTVPSQLPGAVELNPYSFATPTQYLLNIQGIARYLVNDGREIVLCFASNADCCHCMRARSLVSQEWSLFSPTPARVNRRSLRISLSEAFVCWPMTSVSSTPRNPAQPW
jgi:hypothetical protein